MSKLHLKYKATHILWVDKDYLICFLKSVESSTATSLEKGLVFLDTRLLHNGLLRVKNKNKCKKPVQCVTLNERKKSLPKISVSEASKGTDF